MRRLPMLAYAVGLNDLVSVRRFGRLKIVLKMVFQRVENIK